MFSRNISRRSILQAGFGAAAVCTAGLDALALMAEAAKKIPVAVQLYSVRDACTKDLPGTLEAIGKIGFKAVEFAGYYGRKAAELRKMLDDNGLKCCGTHTGLDTLLGDKLPATVEFNKTIGNKFLIVPWLPEDKFATDDACKKTAAQFNELVDKVKGEGMRIGYHAHAGDFKKTGEQTHWDTFFANAGQNVVMQLDVGNCLDGGGDPYAILKKFPGRCASIHIKPHGGKKGAVLGEDEVRWTEIFQLCESVGGTEWYIVEYEEDPKQTDSIKRCFENLKKMGKC